MANADYDGSDGTGHVPSPPQETSEPRDRQPRVDIQVNGSGATTSYANYCRVTGTPEELIIDFGLNAQFSGTPSQPVVISHRLVTSLYTAKRLLRVLQAAVQQHEAVFGAVEIDVQRRVQGR